MFAKKRYSANKDYTKNKWLQRLEQESWELELLVSGFSILLLFKAGQFLENSSNTIPLFLNSNVLTTNTVSIFIGVLTMAVYALIINLTIHLLMRGFWVGIVGLGSVAPKTEFDKLNYSAYFTKKLKNKIGNLDSLVVFVDNVSSLIFAFAFLIVFLLLALGLFFAFVLMVISLVSLLVDYLPVWLEIIVKVATIIIVLFYIFGGIIYFIDFLTLGFIKKSKRLAKVYYPIYTFFGWITLAFLYRIIYYNLISKFSKKRVAFVLVGYLLLMLIIPSLYMDHAIYFEDSNKQFYLSNNFYSDEREDGAIVNYVDIPSKIISQSFMPLFIRYDVNDNGLLQNRFPEFEPLKKEKLQSSFIFHVGLNSLNISYNDRVVEEHPEKALECLSQFYKVYIDDSLIDSLKYYFGKHVNNEEPGIRTMLDINNLKRGEHLLEVKKEYLKKDSLIEKPFAKVPFWKE